MTPNTFAVVRIDVSASGVFVFLDPEDSILRTKNHTIVTFKTKPTTHTSLGFGLCALFRQAMVALLKVA
jgi:hypothetical protein